jgi:phosphoribosyl-ATP pyrophosphohydrolase/phosphoribosyl-AMP cyclohydrolase/histidinol dehydrogenase
MTARSDPLPRRAPDDVTAAAGLGPDAATLRTAKQILDDVQQRGEMAVRHYAAQFGERAAKEPLWLDRDELARAFGQLAGTEQHALQATADRIARFAAAQRASITPFELPVPGGVASQRLAPVARAGCYAPGGRSSLPSSLLMTAVTARTAGVPVILAASPRPTPQVLAAAHLAGVEALLACGGAHAIAALALGLPGQPRCDVIVGPGNRFVTAAKQLVQGRCGIDLPAGPSELVLVADASASPATLAADLLAQAEHDTDARVWLLSCDAAVLAAVQQELAHQLATLPSAAVAAVSLAAGGAVHCADVDQLVLLVDRLAPEHLQVTTADGPALAERFAHYGALFCGTHGAEVFGDYGAGPNHVLPTAGAARFTGGLSVLHFLRVRTWLRLDSIDPALRDAAVTLAELERLPGHAAAARARR